MGGELQPVGRRIWDAPPPVPVGPGTLRAVETFAPLFTALIALALSISTLIRNPRDRLHLDYAFFSAVISTVFLCLFFLILSREEAWRYGLLASALLVAPASAQILLQVIGQRREGAGLLRLLYALAILQLVLIAVFGSQHRSVLVGNAAIVFGGLFLHMLDLWRTLRSMDRPLERQRLRNLLAVGTVAVGAMALEMAFLDWNRQALWPSVPFALPPFGSLATAGYIWFLGQVTLHSRLLDWHEIGARAAVVGFMSLALGFVDLLLVVLAGDQVGFFPQMVNTVVGASLLLVLYEPLRALAEERFNRLFSRQRWPWQQALRDLRRRLPGIIEVEPVLSAMLEPAILGDRLDLHSIYLFDEDRGGFRLRRWRGEAEHALLSAVPQRPFADGFQEGRTWYLLDDLRQEAERSRARKPDWLEGVVATMPSLLCDLSLPLQIGPTVVGLWNLRARPGALPLLEEELRLLRQVADQAAVQFDNSRSFERLKELDRLATLGEMSAGLAHEIRNPLGAIKGAVQVLRKQGGADTEWLGIIVEEVDRLNGVVSQFLDYARPMTVHPARVRPDALVQGVLAMVEAEGMPEGVVLRSKPGVDVPEVPMDIEQLKQVLLNLIRNAREAMEGREGEIVVTTRLVDAGVARQDAHLSLVPGGAPEVRLKRGHPPRAPWIEIAVTDAGCGLRPSQAEKLFIPFFTTKSRGTGLGLAISERIVRRHQGEIGVESSEGHGTRFVVRLPIDWTRGDGTQPQARLPVPAA